jgi:hypothetical protein
MEWLDSIGGLLTGAASGGIFGFLGAAVGGVTKYFATKAEREFEQLKWAHEDKLHAQNLEKLKLEHDNEVQIVAQQGSWDGLEKSLEHDMVASANAYPIANTIKTLFRPFLTGMLTVMQFVIVWIIWQGFVNQEANSVINLLNAPASPATDLLRYTVYSVVFAAQTSIVWWFGERAFAPPGMKNR